MWQTDINHQELLVVGAPHPYSRRHLAELERLAADEPDAALRALYAFLAEWFDSSSTVQVQTSGSTGTPKRLRVEKQRMMASACRTLQALHLEPGQTALLSMNLRYIGAKMMVVRALVGALRLRVVPPSSHPLAAGGADFLSMVPLQLYHTLQVRSERERLAAARVVLVGGGAVEASICRQVDVLPCKVYSTYGMTETLSHVALARLVPGSDGLLHYTPLPGVDVELSPRGTLVVRAPFVCDAPLETNDLAQLYPNGTFSILGRADNTVCSGGIKIQIEEDERVLATVLQHSFALTWVQHPSLGQALVLMVAATCTLPDAALLQLARQVLPRYHVPRRVVRVPALPLTPNGKVDRAACHRLAADV